MAVSTITGLGSGLDINKLVEALANAEKAPKQTQINIQKARNETQLSAVGMLKSAVETFEASLLGLKQNTSAFAAYKASSSKSEVATVTMGSGAVAGSYKLEVTQLATASKVASAIQSSTTYASGGKLTIKIGDNEHELSVAEGASLTDIRNAINDKLSGSAGISANIVTDGQGGSRLVLSSETTGEGADISVIGEGDLARLNISGSQQNGTTSNVTSAAIAVDKFQTGQLNIKLKGVNHPISMAELLGSDTELSLDQLAERLNAKFAAADALKQLRVAVTGEGNERTLTFSSTSSAGEALTVTGTGDLNISASGTVQSGAGYITQAADAIFKLDGLEMSSKTNTVTNLSGLTIRLAEEGTTNLSIAANTDGVVGSVESFVMAYNTLLAVTTGLTKVTQTTDSDGNITTQAGALVADSTLRSMMSQLRRTLSNPIEGAGNLKSLADLGISTNRDGTLALDTDRLRKVVSQDPAALASKRIPVIDPEAIQNFFTGENGLFNRIGDITSVYSGKDGLLASREKSLTDAQNALAADQARLDLRIETLTTSLFKKFNAMDSLVARLNATSQSVLATLNALNKKKDD